MEVLRSAVYHAISSMPRELVDMVTEYGYPLPHVWTNRSGWYYKPAAIKTYSNGLHTINELESTERVAAFLESTTPFGDAVDQFDIEVVDCTTSGIVVSIDFADRDLTDPTRRKYEKYFVVQTGRRFWFRTDVLNGKIVFRTNFLIEAPDGQLVADTNWLADPNRRLVLIFGCRTKLIIRSGPSSDDNLAGQEYPFFTWQPNKKRTS